MKDAVNNRASLPNQLLMSGATALAMVFMAPQAFAQDAPGADTTSVADDEDLDEVVATGIRQALKAARDLKRDADTAVDSITASDVSTLPDLSVAEALARIPGVVVQRFSLGGSEGDFPSPEGGGNLIRGLTLVRSEFNSRDTFSANGGRSLDFGTVPPELIGAVDVYKNTSADLIEGGIGGSINLRTLEPFDKSGPLAVVTLDGTYTDLRDEVSPDFSVIVGNRWDVNGGEFGLLGSFSSSELKSDLHGFQVGQLTPIPNGAETIAVPGGFQLRTNEVDRKRDSYYVASQFRNDSGDFQLTAKAARIENDTSSDERTLEWFTDGEMWFQTSVTGLTTTPFTSPGLPQCNGNNDPTPANPTCEQTQAVTGLYESGLISNSLRDWTGARGANFTNLGIHQEDRSTTDDMSVNIKWRPADQWYVNLDAHRTTATFNRERLWVGSRFFSDFSIVPDLDNPRVELTLDPTNNPSNRAGTGAPSSSSLADPSNAFLLFSADEFQDNEGEMVAIAGDVEYEFDNDGWFDSIKFGARFADRDQINRSAGLNWAAVAPPWAGGGYLPFSELATPTFETVDFSDFFRGDVVQGNNTSVIFADRALISNYDAWVNVVQSDPLITNPTTGLNPDWRPLRENGVVDYNGRGSIGDVTEKTYNLYGRLDFGNEFDNGMSIDGNIGLRYTKADVSGQGGLDYINNDDSGVPGQRPSDFSPEAVAFLAQESIERTGTFSSDERWLPSLNVKWNLNDESLIRFAVSKNITRPRIDQLRGDQSANGAFRFVSNNDPAIPPDQRITDIILNQINIFGGNPDLKPILATNYDLSYEYYFGDENSLTFSAFRKDIKNNIIYGSQTLDTVTLDGREVAIVFNGDINQDEAELQGIEIAYQQFYDNLPGLLSNLGLQANYTYVDAETNAPAPVADADGDGTPDSFERIFRYGVNNFLGLSEHSANIIGIYQDDKLEMRLAYNWRSEYLSSYRDFVTGNPIFQEDRGYLDGSLKYDFNDNLQFRLQVANILDTKAKATQQIDETGQRFARTSFVGDRRIRFGLRYQF
ncbi:TonB-dependent receptor [Algimonas ampicilliniresistens]|uniref:TonB-dependent receptor n=1 Tax=Algimonas ampicilliniresistens TaxID=1298735 RepID=A0ABQ5V4V1_9PROT|nr:TonB-dependent receptor [Algimonas ampicilliniresistens]GLQ22410.1 TonB-dependent receptor [Algimonas ampicilliniresistens]